MIAFTMTKVKIINFIGVEFMKFRPCGGGRRCSIVTLGLVELTGLWINEKLNTQSIARA